LTEPNNLMADHKQIPDISSSPSSVILILWCGEEY